ncbi:MAG: glycosyltransferase [Actinomycetota bacterium]
MLREARSLVQAGHDVTVIALGTSAMPRREERDGIRVIRVPAGRLAGPTILGAGSGGGDAAPQKARSRPPILVWLRDRLLGARMARAAASISADVFHAHDLNTLEPARRAARRRGAALVFDAHELYTELPGLGDGERRRWERLERALIREADAVIVPSPSRGDVLVERYGIATPVVVMNCPDRSPPPDPAAGPLAPLRRGGERLLVYAGGFIAGRGLENLIRAVPLVDGTRLVMIGWGPVEPMLREIARNDGVAERVTFLAPVDPDEVVPTIAGADVGLAPYLPIGLNNELAAPNKLFEYLHAGLAVAASDVPDVRRVVEGLAVGELFDASDPSSVAAAVRRLIADARTLAACRERARAAADRYTWEAQAAVLLRTYEELAATVRTRVP